MKDNLKKARLFWTYKDQSVVYLGAIAIWNFWDQYTYHHKLKVLQSSFNVQYQLTVSLPYIIHKQI